jgi:hypothetical protein
VPKSFSRVGPLRLKEAGVQPRSLFEHCGGAVGQKRG